MHLQPRSMNKPPCTSWYVIMAPESIGKTQNLVTWFLLLRRVTTYIFSYFCPIFSPMISHNFLYIFSANLCKIWHEENLSPHHESEINLAIDHRIPFKATKLQLSSFLPYMNYSKKDSSGRRFRPPCSG